jgi:hypothetical protein
MVRVATRCLEGKAPIFGLKLTAVKIDVICCPEIDLPSKASYSFPSYSVRVDSGMGKGVRVIGANVHDRVSESSIGRSRTKD